MLSRARVIALVVAAGLSAAVACGSRPRPPLPPIARAPEALVGLRVHVVNLTMDGAADAGESTSWNDIFVRAALARSLARAGYVVVVDPAEPHDLRARVAVAWQYVPRADGLVSMTLESSAGVVVQVSGLVARREDDDSGDFDERGSVEIVEAMARTPDLVRFVREPRPPPFGARRTKQAAGP